MIDLFLLKKVIYHEDIPSNLWGGTARNLSDEQFQKILSTANVNVDPAEEPIPSKINLFSIDAVSPMFVSEGETILVPVKSGTHGGDNAGSLGGSRRTRFSKLYGDRAEEVVFKELQKRSLEGLRWVARAKEKPGWEIEYKDNGE